MQIRPHETLADVPILRVRDLMRWLRDAHYGVPVTSIAEFLDIELTQADTLVKELLQRGMIARSERKGRQDDIYYKLTNNGCRLAAANAMKPIKRATAERLLGEFQSRIEPINENAHYLYRVSRVVLFGSYLTNAPTVGDVDLIVHLEPREPNPELHKELCIDRNLDFLTRGWGIGFELIYAFYETLPAREVFVALRKRSAYLSLHSFRDEVVIEGQPQKVLYGPEEYVIPARVRESYGFEDEPEEQSGIERIAMIERV